MLKLNKLLFLVLICAAVIKLFGTVSGPSTNCAERKLNSQALGYCAFNAASNVEIIYWSKVLLRSINTDIKNNSHFNNCKATVKISELQDNIGQAYSLLGDNVEAFKYIKLAAQKGHALAQFRLANMYSYGKGVRTDLVEAYAWISMAFYQGVPSETGSYDINKIAYKAKINLLHNLNVQDRRLSSNNSQKAELKEQDYKKLYTSCDQFSKA